MDLELELYISLPNITCESREARELLSGGGSNNLVGGPVRTSEQHAVAWKSNVWSPFTETKRLWGCDRQVLGEVG